MNGSRYINLMKYRFLFFHEIFMKTGSDNFNINLNFNRELDRNKYQRKFVCILREVWTRNQIYMHERI